MKLLLATSCFPSLDVSFSDPQTKFLYYYAEEWVKQGHSVLVLHSKPCYPALFSKVLHILQKRFGAQVFQLSRYEQDSRSVGASMYEIGGIQVIRTPIRKLIPHRDYLGGELSCHREKVMEICRMASFRPDLSIADFMTPAIYIADDIRRMMETPFFQVIHQSDFRYLTRSRTLQAALRYASGILFRSHALAKRFHNNGFKAEYEDYMFSGVPNDTQGGQPRKSIKKLLYVGWLRVTKNIHVILEALAASRSRAHYELEIVGDGPYEQPLRALAEKLGLGKQVTFSGRLPREQVFEKMRSADCFVMVSKETYGMVYIEALSQGCVVVAAKDQGIDGIVVHDENGFLVECGNVKALSESLDMLALLSESQVARISGNAVQTAMQMTDGLLAKSLLERITARANRAGGGD